MYKQGSFHNCQHKNRKKFFFLNMIITHSISETASLHDAAPSCFSMFTKIKNLVRKKTLWWGNNSTRCYKAYAGMCFLHDRNSQTIVHVLKQPTLKGIPPPTPVSTIIFFTDSVSYCLIRLYIYIQISHLSIRIYIFKHPNVMVFHQHKKNRNSDKTHRGCHLNTLLYNQSLLLLINRLPWLNIQTTEAVSFL